jgi:hypothetical protein
MTPVLRNFCSLIKGEERLRYLYFLAGKEPAGDEPGIPAIIPEAQGSVAGEERAPQILKYLES